METRKQRLRRNDFDAFRHKRGERTEKVEASLARFTVQLSAREMSLVNVVDGKSQKTGFLNFCQIIDLQFTVHSAC